MSKAQLKELDPIDIKKAIFCDTDLSGVHFNDCNMSEANLRGGSLSFCKIGAYGEYVLRTDSVLRSR